MLVLQMFYLQIMYCFGFSRRSWHENQRTHSSMWDLHSSTEEQKSTDLQKKIMWSLLRFC